MTLSKFKTGLLLGTAFLLTACNGDDATETAEATKAPAETAATETAAIKDSDYKMVTLPLHLFMKKMDDRHIRG